MLTLPDRRRLLMEIAVMLYGREIWAETLEVKKRANSLVSAQKGFITYRDGIAYSVRPSCTCDSWHNSCGSVEIYKAKPAGRHITGHFREKTITKWQRRWDDEDRKWTPRLIPDVRPWIGRKFGEIKY